jgi:hypothetical protein
MMKESHKTFIAQAERDLKLESFGNDLFQFFVSLNEKHHFSKTNWRKPKDLLSNLKSLDK